MRDNGAVRDMPIQRKKELTQERLTSAYSLDYLSLEEFEKRITKLGATEEYDEIDELVADLPTDLVPVSTRSSLATLGEPEQILEGSGQVLERRGEWLKSQNVVLKQRGSVVRLELDELRDLRNVAVKLELEVTGSTVRIRVPRGTRVRDETNNHSSVIRINRRLYRHADPDGPVLVLDGSVRGSVVRVLPLRGRRR